MMIQHSHAQDVKYSPILTIGFLKPFEITLRIDPNSNRASNTLPTGLQQVIKMKSINDNKFQLAKFHPIPSSIETFQQLKENNMNNYISLLKVQSTLDESQLSDKVRFYKQSSSRQRQTQSNYRENTMKLGICITMSGENKKTLKKTMAGIAQNINKLHLNEKIASDNIFVVIIVDGMKNLDKSLYEYFTELEKYSKTYLDDGQDLAQHIGEEQGSFYKANKLFKDKEELTQRLNCKPQSVHQQYSKIANYKEEIARLLHGNGADRTLRDLLTQSNYFQQEQQRDEHEHSKLLNHLAEIKENCQLYLSSREKLAYVAPFKIATKYFSEDVLKDQERRRKELESLIRAGGGIIPTFGGKTGLEQVLIKIRSDDDPLRYMNLFFCIKYQQSGKLSSHNWFFNGFCQELKPKYTIMIDAGVVPGNDSIYRMYKCLSRNPKVGGVCGYLKIVENCSYDFDLIKQLSWISKFFLKIFDIQKGQQIMNHFQYLVRKPFESLCGCIINLPDSFSAYNMEVLNPVNSDDKLLSQYFKQLNDKVNKDIIVPSSFGPKQIFLRFFFPKSFWRNVSSIDENSEQQILYNANVYQSENPVLCLGIYKNSKIIVYMPDVEAEVQSVTNLSDFMSKQKKQINGSIFSAKNAKRQLSNIQKNQLSLLFQFQFLYLNFSHLLSYFIIATFIFLFDLSLGILKTEIYDILGANSTNFIDILTFEFIQGLLMCLYIMIIGGTIIRSLNLNGNSKKLISQLYLSATIVGMFSLLSIGVLVFEAVQIYTGDGSYFQKRTQEIRKDYPNIMNTCIVIYRWIFSFDICVFLIPYLLYSILYKRFDRIGNILSGIISFLFYFPTFFLLIPIYAKSRLDVISMPIKQSKAKMKMLLSWRIIKMVTLGKFVLWNAVIAIFLLSLDKSMKFLIFIFVLLVLGVYNFIRIVLAAVYLVSFKCKKMFRLNEQRQQSYDQSYYNPINQDQRRVYHLLARFKTIYEGNHSKKGLAKSQSSLNSFKSIKKLIKSQEIQENAEKPQQFTIINEYRINEL